MKRGRPSPASERRTFRAAEAFMQIPQKPCVKLYASVRLDGKLPIVRDPFQYAQGHDIDAAHHAIEEKLAEKDKKNV